jgi:DNA-binding transcriptional LysR family regulator
MAEFERTYPGISVDLRIANSRVIEEQIRANDLDLGVVGTHGLRRARNVSRPHYSTSLY